MAQWRIEFEPPAAKDLKKLDPQTRAAILRYLRQSVLAANNPRQLGKALIGTRAGLWRYRVDKYRIICHIEEAQLVVLVIRVDKRDKVYK